MQNATRTARREVGARRLVPAGFCAERSGASQEQNPSSSRLRLDVRPRRATVAVLLHQKSSTGGCRTGRANLLGRTEVVLHEKTLPVDCCVVEIGIPYSAAGFRKLANFRYAALKALGVHAVCSDQLEPHLNK